MRAAEDSGRFDRAPVSLRPAQLCADSGFHTISLCRRLPVENGFSFRASCRCFKRRCAVSDRIFKERHIMKDSVIGNAISDRRAFLKKTGAAFAAASMLTEPANGRPRTAQCIYLHGLVWNTALPGAEELLITFDLSATLGGTGLGSFADAVHSQVNSHVAFDSASAGEGALESNRLHRSCTQTLEHFDFDRPHERSRPHERRASVRRISVGFCPRLLAGDAEIAVPFAPGSERGPDCLHASFGSGSSACRIPSSVPRPPLATNRACGPLNGCPVARISQYAATADASPRSSDRTPALPGALGSSTGLPCGVFR
jgi:hypothetical protein